MDLKKYNLCKNFVDEKDSFNKFSICFIFVFV